MKKNYKKSILIFINVLFAIILTFFTILAMNDYRHNVIIGSSVSILVLISYFFILNKSLYFFNQERIGLAYFLSIGGFFGLMFIQLINCSNSVTLSFH